MPRFAGPTYLVVKPCQLLVELLVLLVDVCHICLLVATALLALLQADFFSLLKIADQSVYSSTVRLVVGEAHRVRGGIEAAILVDRNHLAIVGLDNLKVTIGSSLFNSSDFLPFISLHIWREFPHLPLVYLPGILSVVLECHVVPVSLLLLHTSVPFLGFVDCPIPGSLTFKIFSCRFRVCFEKVVGGECMLA